MTIIELNKRYYTVPTQWNELSQQQLIAVMETLFMRQYTGEQGCLKLLKILLGFNWWQFFRSKPTEMAEYFYLTLFLLSEQRQLTDQLLPVYDELHGPDKEFNNLVMQELAICDGVFMQWAEDRENHELLNQLCSLLYRPAKEDYNFKKNIDGDARIPFNQNLCEYYCRTKVHKWPMSVKLAIAYWYDACRWQLVEENEDVFGGDNSGEVSKYGLVSVMLSVAESGSLGDFSKVEQHNVHTVMIQLNESIRKAKEQEKAMKK